MQHMDSRDGEFEEVSTPRLQNQIERNAQEEDGKLDELHAGAKRIKNHAKRVNNEVTEQNVIIDNLGDDMGRGAERLRQEALTAEEINKSKKKFCCLYSIIAVEILILIVVIAFAAK